MDIDRTTNHQTLDNLVELLACPYCHGTLQFSFERAFCNNCGTSYPVVNGRFDFRLQKPKKTSVVYTIKQPDSLDVKLEVNRSTADLRKTDLIPKPVSSAVMLDLGCGEAFYEQIFRDKGYRYVGIDINSAKAMVLGDAHALPFKDESFDLIYSHAVIEHLQYPLVAMLEVHRVLKPNNFFIGSAAFMEPFHGDSYVHHTHLGLSRLFRNAGFTMELLAAHSDYNMLNAHASMSLFPGMPKKISRSLVAPLNLLHGLWWKIGSKMRPDKLSEERRLARTAAAFLFKLRKDLARAPRKIR